MNTVPDQTTAIAAADHRNAGEPAITVQNVSVQDGGKIIVGNVTQHASVIASDARRHPVTAKTEAHA